MKGFVTLLAEVKSLTANTIVEGTWITVIVSSIIKEIFCCLIALNTRFKA